MRLPCVGCTTGPEAGLYLQLLSGICASAMGLVAKVVGSLGIPVFEIVLARSIVVLVLSVGMVAWSADRKIQWPWRSDRRWLLLVRGLVGFGAISCYYAAVQLLPLADAAVLTFLSPVFVALFAPLVLGEGRGGWPVVLSLPLCFVGVLLVAQPTFLFDSNSQALSIAGVAIAVVQAVFMAAAKCCVRLLGKSESVGSIMLSMAAVSVLGSAVLAALVPGQWLVLPPGVSAWALLVGTGMLACGVQTLATYALKLSKATPVTLMGYLSVVWGILGDLVVYHRKPSGPGLLGACLVCSSSLIIILAEKQQAGSSVAAGNGGGELQSEVEGAALLVPQPSGLKAKSSGPIAVLKAAAYPLQQHEERKLGSPPLQQLQRGVASNDWQHSNTANGHVELAMGRSSLDTSQPDEQQYLARMLLVPQRSLFSA